MLKSLARGALLTLSLMSSYFCVRPLFPPPFQLLSTNFMVPNSCGWGAHTPFLLPLFSRCLAGWPKYLGGDPLCSLHWYFSHWDLRSLVPRRAWACLLPVEVSRIPLSLSVCLICEVDRAGRICFKSCSRSRCRYVIPSLCYSQMLDLTQPCAMISRWRRNSLLD
jgi:hypothetical protein